MEFLSVVFFFYIAVKILIVLALVEALSVLWVVEAMGVVLVFSLFLLFISVMIIFNKVKYKITIFVLLFKGFHKKKVHF